MPDGVTAVTEFSPEYPQQYRNISYGLADVYDGEDLVGQEWRYLPSPSPGAANGAGWIDFVEIVEVSQQHGFYDDPFTVTLQTATPAADIYFSFDGSIPGPENGGSFLYDGPITIDTTTVLRAAGYLEEYGRSVVNTQTYIFIEDVLTQSIDPHNPENNPFGLNYPEFWQNIHPGKYDMNPEIVEAWDDFNPTNDDYGIRESLLSIPTMSIVMDHEDMWNVSTGIHPNARNRGDAWRRAGSIEYFDPAGGDGFQYNVGIQMHGGSSRNAAHNRKHSFRLIFNPDFEGPGRLDFPIFDQSDFADINTLVLKGGNQDNFSTRTITSRVSPLASTYMRDQWVLDTHRAMGHVAPEFTYVHLYVNGLYWGLTYAIERTDDAMLASRLGGEREDWDVIRQQGDVIGSDQAWNELFDLAREMDAADPVAADAIYFQLQGMDPDGTPNSELPVYLDMDSLIDYLMLHYYTGAREWGNINYVYARNRVDPGTGFQFFVWDQDVSLDGFFANRMSAPADGTSTAQELSMLLRASPEFKLRFADRAHRNLFNDGALTDSNAAERWQGLADKIEPAILAESARWGDARAGEEVIIWSGDDPIILPTITIDHWRDSVDAVHGYLPQSRSLLINRMTSVGFYTALRPPLISQFGGPIDPSDPPNLSKPPGSPSSAEIYYTLDGSDPRLIGGELSPTAVLYDGSVNLNHGSHINARMLNGSTWSAIVTAEFGVSHAEDFSFDFVDQTYEQSFDFFRGTEPSLPPHFTIDAGGADIFREVFDTRTDSASDFTGIMATTSDGENYSLVWRESTGSANLDDARILFTFTNNTGVPLTGFDVSYDVEAWVNGRRDNQVRFKYDIYPDSSISQPAEGRNAFETDIFATPNPNHTPIASNDAQFVLDGKDPANRTTVSGYVDLLTLLVDENDPSKGVFGALAPGQTAYFRWQISNADLTAGNRSALGIDNVSITARVESTVESADFNSDGIVDGFDFLAWQRGFGSTDATPADGDANHDGIVDGADLVIWENQFGQPAPIPSFLAEFRDDTESSAYPFALDSLYSQSSSGNDGIASFPGEFHETWESSAEESTAAQPLKNVWLTLSEEASEPADQLAVMSSSPAAVLDDAFEQQLSVAFDDLDDKVWLELIGDEEPAEEDYLAIASVSDVKPIPFAATF